MAVISEGEIRELAAFRGSDAPVTTCYLDVDGRRYVRPQDYEAELDRMLRDARDRDPAATADLDRIQREVRAGFDRSGTRGLALFSCQAHGLWRVVRLPMSVRNRIVVNSAPAVGQLELVVQEYGPIGVLLVDRQRARMFIFEVGELTERTELVDELPRAYDHRGHGDQGYEREQHHVEELAHQHLRHAAHAAFELFQQHPFKHLVVGGPDAVVHELERELHPYLKERLCGRIPVGVAAGLEEIRRVALEIEGEVDRRIEADQVGRLRDAVASGGKAVAGLESVLGALGGHRVERLLVSDGFEQAGWRCGPCGLLAVVGRTCKGCGGDMAHVDDVVEDAVEIALASGTKVDVCVGNADLDVLGRIGAFLRY